MSKKNIAPRYLRKLKDGQWFYFKYKDEHWCATEWNEFPYAFKKPNSPLLFSPNSLGGYEVISGWMISYFRPCSEKFAKQQIEQAEATKICNDYNKALNRIADEFQKQEEIIRLKCEIEQLKAEQEVDNYLKDQFLKVWRTRNEY